MTYSIHDLCLGVDYGGCIILKYRKGGMASLAYSIRCTNSNNIATIHGTKGYMEVSFVPCYQMAHMQTIVVSFDHIYISGCTSRQF